MLNILNNYNLKYSKIDITRGGLNMVYWCTCIAPWALGINIITVGTIIDFIIYYKINGTIKCDQFSCFCNFQLQHCYKLIHPTVARCIKKISPIST